MLFCMFVFINCKTYNMYNMTFKEFRFRDKIMKAPFRAITRVTLITIGIIFLYLFASNFRYEKIRFGDTDVAILDKWTGDIERIKLN